MICEEKAPQVQGISSFSENDRSCSVSEDGLGQTLISGENIIVHNFECSTERISCSVRSVCLPQHCKSLDDCSKSSLAWNDGESLQ